MKKSTACLLTLATLLLCASARAQNMQDQSLNYQAGPAHTGFISSPAVAPPFRKKWTVNFGQNISYPVVADGRVFVTVRNPSSGPYGTKLYALDAATGATLWGPIANAGTYYWSALTYENGRLFMLNYDGQLTAHDAATGGVVWTRKLGGTFGGFDSAPTAFRGVIYTGGGSNGNVYAVSADTGALLWSAPVTYGDNSSPALTPDGLYVSYACAASYKFNPSTGGLLWNYRTDCSGGGGKTTVFHEGRLYIRDASKGNLILDGQTGANLGSYSSRNAPAFSGNLGFFTAGSGYLYENLKLEARDLSNNNALVWSFGGDGFLRSAPLVIDNHVYIGSDTGMLYALDKQTGQKVWSMNAGASIPHVDEHNVSQPLTGFAAGSGMLFIPTATTLVAFEGDHVAPTLQWGAASSTGSGSAWYNTPVDIPYTTSDNLPGVVRSSAPNPLRFAAEGANQTRQVTVTDEAGNSATYTSPAVSIDMTTPSTAASYSGPAGSGEWYGGGVQVTLNASDNLSGVAATSYTVDGGPSQIYSGPFVVSGEGNHSVTFSSVDAAGNYEQHKSIAVGIDSAAPSTQFSAAGTQGDGGWYRSAVQITLAASDNLSGAASTFYTVDGGPAQTYAGPFSLSADGRHQLSYWSVDRAGNTESAKSFKVDIDATSASTQSAVSGPAGGNSYYKGDVQVTLTASDSLSGLAATFYELDGGAAQAYSGPFAVSGEGGHTVNFWSVDAAGNAEARQTLSVGIDASAPSTQFSAAGNQGGGGWFRGPGAGPVQITLAASDSHSGSAGTFYQIDGGPVQTYAGAFPISGEGRHQLSYWSVDRAGNAEPAKSAPVNIDATGATVQSNAAGPIGNSVYFGGPVQVTLTGADNLSGVAGVFYRIDDGPVQTYSAPFAVTGDGTHPVDFWATDVAGNTSNTFTYRIMIRIDATAPSTQAAAAGTNGDNGWYRGPVQVTLAASDALSGVKGSYFYVDGGATQLYGAPFTVSGDGVRTLRFWSMDQANNAEAQQSLVLRIDNGAPLITVASSPSTAQKNRNPAFFNVSGRITDAASGVRAGSTTFSVVDEYGVSQPSGAVTLKADGTYSFTLSLPATRNSKDADGHRYTITVRGSDAAGNSGSGSIFVTIL